MIHINTDLVKEMFLDGKSIQEIAKIIDVKYQTLLKRVRPLEWFFNRQQKIELDQVLLKELFLEGLSNIHIAEKLKVDKSVVYSNLIKTDYYPINKRAIIDEKVLSGLYFKHRSFAKIGIILGISKEEVATNLRKYQWFLDTEEIQDVEKLKELYFQGKSRKQIARYFNTSPHSVRMKLFQQDWFLKRNMVGDLVGKKFGMLLVIKVSDKRNSSKQILYECKCDCTNTTFVNSHRLTTGHTTSCGCKGKTGTDLIPGTYWGVLMNRALNKNLEFNITIEYAHELFIKQNGECALSGQSIILPGYERARKEQTASVDRIDSSKGYIVGNIQWVHKLVNTMKWSLPDEKFIDICHMISNYQKQNSLNLESFIFCMVS